MSDPTTTHPTTGYQRHPLEIGPLVFGLIFLGVVAAWGLFELGAVTAADAAWILPIVLIGAGALGVLLALTKPRRTEARQAALAAYAGQWAPAPYPEQEDRAYADTAVHDDTREQTTTTGPWTADTDTDLTDTDTDPGTDLGTDPGSRERHDD